MERSESKPITILNLGLRGYQEVWDIQKQYFNQLLNAKLTSQPISENYIILCQHPHVITLGKSGNESNIQVPQFPGVEYIRIDRGGDITYHGPGQLVVYPILDLEMFGLGLKSYIHILEEAVIQTLQQYNITGGRIKEFTGVWLDVNGDNPRKIAAIGVKTSRHVTMHGLAFNIEPDLNMFDLIIPCGIVGKGVTSMQKELQSTINFDEVSEIFVKCFLELIETSISKTL